jgi:PAS domain S-box-containing protein
MNDVAAREPGADALHGALRIGLLYFSLGALWILFTDGLVEALWRDAQGLLDAQRYKGLVFVALTSAGLVYLVHRGYRRQFVLQARAESSELSVQDLFEHHPQPMWVYETGSFRFLRVNAAALAAYGYGREEFLAMSARDIRPAAEAAPFLAAAAPYSLGTGSPGVFRHQARDGRLILARISEHRVNLSGQHATMVMAEDVTDEVSLQDAVRRQQRQYQQLHQSLGEVLWMATPDCHSVLYVSSAFEALYGRTAAELKADPTLWSQAVHPEDLSRVADLRKLAPGQDSLECDYRIVRPDGSVRWVLDRKRLIRDETGSVVLVGGIVEDITARKERDEAREALNSRLEALVAARTSELQQANIELEAFSRTAAHDLKSPLNGIAGMSGLLRLKAGDRLDETSQHYLELIERSSRDMARLINDLLALSRAGNLPLQTTRVDLAPKVRALVEHLRTLEPHRQVAIDMPERLDMVCDEGLMQSVLHNLLGNAWKFTSRRDDARIVLQLERRGDELELRVSDNGAGFDTSGIGALLRPFQRFHTQGQFQGTGLGLVTCQRIAHRHGGRLVLRSRPGEGSQVGIVLPAPAAATGLAADPQAPAIGAPSKTLAEG